MKIKVFSDFNIDYFKDGADLEFVQRDFEYAIVMNCAKPALALDPKNVLGISMEPTAVLNPNVVKDYCINNVGKYICRNATGLPSIFVEHHGWIGHNWFTMDEMNEQINKADFVLSHLGCGIAREVQEAKKPTVFFCRSKERGEHFDNHQLELKSALEGRQGLRFYEHGDDLEKIIEELKDEVPSMPENKAQLVEALKVWIKG